MGLILGGGFWGGFGFWFGAFGGLAFEVGVVGGGVEFGVGDGEDGVGGFEEGLDEGVHFRDEVWVLGGEVGGFAEVLLEVEEFPAVGGVFSAVEDADEFPVVAGDGDGGGEPIGDGGIVGEVGEDGVAREGLAFEGGEDADAVEGLAGLWI